MGGVIPVLQAAVDFLVDERCHACGALVAPHGRRPPAGHPAVEALAEAIGVGGPAGARLCTRPLCHDCLGELHTWPAPLLLSGGAGRDGWLPLFPTFTTDTRLLAVVHLLKFGRLERVATWLGRAMAVGLPSRARSAGALLVPVPMDAASRRRRGFNQAESLARETGRRWGLPLVCRAIEKPRATAAQSLLDRTARARNLAGAFFPGRDAPRVAGRTVLLVDDLVTTGATARACARVLYEAGAEAVRVVSAGYRR
jgi:ComF family protein